jgi:hypothetical protein
MLEKPEDLKKRQHERDTKKSSCNPVMGYDAKCKKHRVYGATSTAASIMCVSITRNMTQKMPHGIDSIYMGCHILSSVSCINSELIDFCSLYHLTITACSTAVIFINNFHPG